MTTLHLSLGLFVLLATAPPPGAQGGCIGGTLNEYLNHPNVVAIFRGTVTSVKAVPPSLTWPRDRRQIATMTVTRVWKGEVSSATALHLWLTEGRDARAGFQPGMEYVAIAHELSADARQWFGLPRTGERALGVNGWACGVMSIDSPPAIRLLDAAPGYPPKP